MVKKVLVLTKPVPKDPISGNGASYILRSIIKMHDMLGLWKDDDRKRVLGIILFLNAFIIITIPQVYTIYEAQDLNFTLNRVHIPLEFTLGTLKGFMYYKNRKILRKLMDDIDADSGLMVKSDVKSGIFKQQDRKFRNPFSVYLLFGILYTIGVFVGGCFTGQTSLKSNYGIDINASKWLFMSFALYDWFTFLTAVWLHVAFDAIPAGVFCAIETRLKIFQYYQTLMRTKMEAKNHTEQDDLDYVAIRRIVIEYEQIRSLKERAEELFSGVIFIQCCMSGIVMSTGLVQLSKVNTLLSAGDVMFVPTMLFELWTYMYYINELTETSKQLLFSMEQSNWIHLSVQNKKNLILAQQGMIEPLSVRCYKMFYLNMKVYTTVNIFDSLNLILI